MLARFFLREPRRGMVLASVHRSCQDVTVIPFVGAVRKKVRMPDLSRRLMFIATLRESLIHLPCRGSVASESTFFESAIRPTSGDTPSCVLHVETRS